MYFADSFQKFIQTVDCQALMIPGGLNAALTDFKKSLKRLNNPVFSEMMPGETASLRIHCRV
jgi:hypothetical protein